MVKTKGSRLRHLLGATALAGIAFNGVIDRVMAQQTSDAQQQPIDEVVVTATRRSIDVAKIPYNITAVNTKALEQSGISTIQDLAAQVPNLTVTSGGNQLLGAQREIIRGLDASSTSRYQSTEQNPVSTYLDNSPFGNFFQLGDLQRVEVLRGPQGTLYGAGTLGGAIRLVTNKPNMDTYEGSISSGFEGVSHSSDLGYNVKAMLNVPITDQLAFRVSASDQHYAGFIDQSGVYVETGGQPYGVPVPVNPAAPLTSPAQTYTVKDVNSSDAINWRAAVRARPTDDLDITVSFNLSHLYGFGPEWDTAGFAGEPNPLAPTANLQATGPYQVNNGSLMPFSRQSKMTTVDASYDLGFATLSTTASVFETQGETVIDQTYDILALPYVSYYTGSPINPRFAALQAFADRDQAFTGEVRLVSKGDSSFDYTVGAYYQHENSGQYWSAIQPGTLQYFATPGVTVLGGGPTANGTIFNVNGANHFDDCASSEHSGQSGRLFSGELASSGVDI